MKRAFLLNILFLLSVNLLIKPFYIFGIDRTVQNRVGLEDYGLYATLFSFTFLLQIINDFGLQHFNNRNIAQHHQLLPKYFPNMLILKLGLGIIYTFLTLIVAFLIGYGSRQFHLLFFFIFNQILMSAIAFFRSNISGLGFYRTDSLVTILDRLLLIIICSFLLFSNFITTPFQIEWFVYAQSSSLLLTAIVAGSLVFNKLPYFQLKFNPAFLWLILKKSYPFALAVFLMTIYTRIDFVMIERMLVDGEKEAGIYASAYRLLDAVNVLGILFAGLLLPMSARLLKEKQSIRPLLRFSLQMLLCGAIILGVTTCFFRKEIMFLLYEDASIYSANILGILMGTFMIISTGYIYSTLLAANNSLREMNQVFIIAVLLNIGFNYVLIPRYGALGAAWATFFTQGFALISQIFIAKKAFQLKTDFNLIGRFLLLGFLIALVSSIIIMYSSLPWFFGFIIVLLVGLGIGFLLNLLKVAAFLDLVKTKGE
ncbi:MAG: oligosaccharide flippase family protein [Saprospiraceae bacterium]